MPKNRFLKSWLGKKNLSTNGPYDVKYRTRIYTRVVFTVKSSNITTGRMSLHAIVRANGIIVHKVPRDYDVRHAGAIKRQKRRVNFVKLKCAKILYPKHFKSENFVRMVILPRNKTHISHQCDYYRDTMITIGIFSRRESRDRRLKGRTVRTIKRTVR